MPIGASRRVSHNVVAARFSLVLRCARAGKIPLMSQTPTRRFGWRSTGLLLCAVALVYAPQLGHPFHYDDHWKIVNNPRLRDASFLLEDVQLGSYSEALTRLLPNLSLALNYAWHGLSPFAYNLWNLLFHLGNVALVFSLARVLGTRFGGASPHFAWLSAALFGLHPLNSEAVYYVNARPNVMLTLFFLAALRLLVAAIETPREQLGRRAGLLLACALSALAALLCKEVAITWLAVAPALVYFLSLSQPEPYARWVRRGLPFAAALVVLGGAFLFFTGALAGVQRQLGGRSLGQLLVTFADQSAIVFRYLGILLWPSPQLLSIDHGALGHLVRRVFSGQPLADSALMLVWPTLSSLLLLFALDFAWHKRRRAPLATFALFFFALTHAPLWLFPRGEVMVEYRMYLPMVGLCMLLAHGLDRGTALLAERWNESALVMRKLGYGFVLVLLGSLTLVRGRAWASEEAMWRDVLDKAPSSPRAYVALGENARRSGDLDTAIELLQRSVELDPMYARGLSSLGGLQAVKGDLEAAKASLERALALDPKDYQAASNLGNVWMGLGRPELAKRYYEEALAIQPLFPEALLNLGRTEHKLGHFERAMAHFRRALELAPDLGVAYLVTGRALMDHGDVHAAIDTWERGLAVDYRQPAMHAQLAQALSAVGQRDAAVQHLRIAQSLAPGNPDVVAATRRVLGGQ